MRKPFVSIIISTRNEKQYITNCLNSIISQDYPKNRLEVFIVDGFSEDGTRKIAEKYLRENAFIKILDNPRKFTSFAFNIGIKKSKGEVIMLMGAHAKYERDYISKCVEYLKKYRADNVGGILKTLSFKNSLMAKSIAKCLSSYFGAGNSHFRTGLEEPSRVDTVFGGCYRREVFDKVGFFNESLLRSQDMEFNIRLKKAGGKILLVPDIVAYYYPKDNLKDFLTHNIEDGIWAVLPLKFVKLPFKLRHYVPLIFVLTLPFSIWPYIIASLYFSLKIAVREKSWKYFFVMPVVFGVRHIGYGIGSLLGLIKLI